MPLWLIHHDPNVFSNDEKEKLAQTITQLYVGFGLPAFYVQVQFFELPYASSFIGGEKDRAHVTLTIYHLARTMTTEAQAQRFLGAVDGILTPTFQPKELEWEYFVTETPRNLWKINGLVPPPAGSDEEREWARINKAVKL
ncbi:hypothetical protein P175DRAFT_0503871 [Aspergillus ochraceoroseus IBT 24754]|uniref:Tautomerase cis-CaaD-like domain-containing protein n=3 Tax=Aspergillus subgen. Nidulantes TaxID=2720870 RepID=A0A0F8WBI2_9EURO|nr:uncharacterized protein P175DRAFT_0503871 [Aspergillus ochraceoroseus IBT 24754]KKK15190.1 hypothetical protein ARAM_002015 [Aspergillus rambellii]PTU17976.1 hypothetical protein P175DRAFT_0503871 [Aspergillus ochraceoroseus IBT 24754]